jgi:sigma-B regulation protein RsbQ
MKALLCLTLALSLSGASVDGINIHWTSAGKGKKAVILVHGWTSDESAWAAQVPALAAKYRVITLDLPGHGKSGSPADGKFSMDLFARAVDSVRREAKVTKAVLVGHSMGTPVVRQYARLFPKNTVALVLVDGVVAKPESGPIYASLAQRFSGPDGPKNHEGFIKALFTVTPEALQAGIIKGSMATPESTVTGAMMSMSDPAIWKADVIAVPALGLYADKSRLGDKEFMTRVFPKLEYVEIPGTDHFLMMEKPDEFNQLLLAFLAKLSW